MRTGLVHVYTGEGKGKTTAAVGLAVRALGHGLKVCYCSFHKRPEVYGYNEIKQLQKLGAVVYSFAKGHPFCNKTCTAEDLALEIKEALHFLSESTQKQSYELLILDEINISVRDGFLPESQLIQFIKNKPAQTELVLTGRDATEHIINLADYVSYMRNIKHPYNKNILSRSAIEY